MPSTRSSSPRSSLALLLAVGVWAVAIAPVAAQPAQPPDEKTPPDEKKPPEASNMEMARTFYLEAHRQHTAGEYADAAENYLKAYAVFPKSAFIYNAAQVYRLDGQKEKALEHYKRYLELDPDGDGAARAREFIPAIEAEIAAAKGAEGGTGDPLETGDGKTGDGKTGKTGGDVIDTSIVDVAAEPLPVVSRDSIDGVGRGKRIGGLVMVGVGAALVGGGVGFALHGRSLSKEASDFTGPAGPELDDLYTRGEAADRNMVIMLSAGALTAAAGGVVYFLGVRSRGRAEHDLELFVSPSGAGVSGRF